MSQQTVGARVSHNAISNYIGQAYSMFITLASVPICIKYLGTEAYGLIGFFVLLQNFTSFLDFGLSITINRLIAQAKVISLVESRVCPYENSPDGNFLFDKHPEAGNIIFLGGGSGHGFKHGPALGEWVAGILVK